MRANWKPVSAATGGTVLAMAYYYTQIYDWAKTKPAETEEEAQRRMRDAAVAKITSGWHNESVKEKQEGISAKLIQRIDEESILESIYDAKELDTYLILVGKKGSGKSTLVERSFHDKKDVIYVRLQRSDAPKKIWEILYSAIGFLLQKVPEGTPPGDHFEALCRQAKKMSGKAPVLVVEIESRDPDDMVKSIFSAVKVLTCDRQVAKGVIVLSDALAARHLTPDTRRKYLWVGDFTYNQAMLYLDASGFKMKVQAEAIDAGESAKFTADPDAYVSRRKQQVFDQVGTHVMDLNEAVQGTQSIDEFIQGKIRSAEGALLNTIAWGRKQKPALPIDKLVEALLESPSGLTEKETEEKTGINSAALFPVLKEYHAIVFDVQKQVFRLSSPAIRTAALQRKKLSKGA